MGLSGRRPRPDSSLSGVRPFLLKDCSFHSMEVLSHLAYLLKYHLPLPAMTSCLNFQRFQLHSASPRLFLAGTVRETPLHGSLVLGLARGDSDRRASGVGRQ